MQGMMCWIVKSSKELHWFLCTGWTLGWCRILPMPVSIESYGCCPVVVDWCLMLSHTQCNRSPGWSERWPGTASGVCLCLLPTSNEQQLGWSWEPPCISSLAHWCAPWMRGASTLEGSRIVFILGLIPGFNGLGKDNFKTRQQWFKFRCILS